MTPPLAPLIATVDQGSALFREVLPWLVALLVLAVVGGIVIMIVRRWVRSSDAPPEEGFTLHDLRQLHAAGRLGDEEFERAKAKLIERVKAAASENADAEGPHDSPDRRRPTDDERE
ncbi:MAG: SHOCT domain-containing protein [Planctomycetota bacterium]|nr:SHOCT domain-containing protein [Planctomycetota bacterium]